jgi:3-hydroxyphenylacetate 6-hydroxylase
MFGEISYLLHSSSSAFILVLICLTILNLLYETRRKTLRIPQFSGPAGWPVIGSLWDIKGSSAQQFWVWSKSYGDVFQIQLGDIPVLVVNSASAAKAIFSGHSNALCSRPVFFTFHKVPLQRRGLFQSQTNLS